MSFVLLLSVIDKLLMSELYRYGSRSRMVLGLVFLLVLSFVAIY